MAKSVYEMVTERIIEQLEKGVIPWQKPWTGIKSGAYNRVSKKSYSLLNQLLLQHEGEYATFKRWQGLGSHIRKSEKSEIVVIGFQYCGTMLSLLYQLQARQKKQLVIF